MQTRLFGKTNESVSLLGYGMMRLPALHADTDDIDYEKALAHIDYAYRHGVNYFDTAYMYHGGKSELFAGEALSRYPRESFYLADKMPAWMIGNGGVSRAKEIFADQLNKCRVDYFDFYLLHALSRQTEFDKIYLEDGVLAYLKEEKAKGRIRHLGFSFHGSIAFFEYLMTVNDWDFCQIQCNYLDWDKQSAKELYRIAEEHGVQLIIMEPVRGGALAKLNEAAVDILKAAEPEKSVASWAIRFVASLENVLCVLSGMSDMAQVEDNIATLTDFSPLTEQDHKTIKDALDAYAKDGVIGCTACRYCFDCPKQIMIPELFALYNAALSEERLPVSVGITEKEFSKRKEAFLSDYRAIPEGKRAEDCVKCGKCAEHCPQTIKIPERLAEIARIVSCLS